ncbi:MAG: type II secretion system F family protein [Pirellulales bacterium]|nr:type II secretion system F family protein [Pirellulales bacterium]
MSPILIGIAAFIAIASLVGGVAVLLHEKPAGKIEDRLDVMTGQGRSSLEKGRLAAQNSILNQPLEDQPSFIENVLNRFGNFELFFEQADTSLTFSNLMMTAGILTLVGAGAGAATGINLLLIPIVALIMGSLPLVWLFLRRRRRLRAFAVQLPDALEMLGRSLRAGQSLAAGFNAISEELSSPISDEFGRVFEEQNLGIALEDSLNSLGERIPNLDLQFFCTAVILQRQTGGDLAEILDKIGSLIRERFQIWGQVQALTGEGRLSGAVLLGLPVALFLVVYQMNPDYVSVLFTDPLGKKMLAGAIVMQIFGALVIRKIVNIKV